MCKTTELLVTLKQLRVRDVNRCPSHKTVFKIKINTLDQLASSELWRTKQIPKNALKMSGNLGKLTL